MRYLWRDLQQPGRLVERITLSSFAKSFAPMVSALTMESPGSDQRLAPPRSPAAPPCQSWLERQNSISSPVQKLERAEFKQRLEQAKV